MILTLNCELLDNAHYVNITFFMGWHGRSSPLQKVLSTLTLPPSTMFSWGDNLPCHLVKNVRFINSTKCPNFLHNFNIMLLSYFTYRATFSMNVTHCYGIARNAATTAIVFSIRTICKYSWHIWHFFNVTHPILALIKTVWHKKKCRPFNLQIRSQETK